MLTLARKSEICAINLEFAAEFARERSTQADGRWFEPSAPHAPATERRHEALALYLARQKARRDAANQDVAKKA